MRSRWNFPIYVIYLAMSLAVIGFIVAQMGITPPWSHPYTLTANFADAADILNNNEVYMNGTKVGHVGEVSVINGLAHVQLVIDDAKGLPIHSDGWQSKTCDRCWEYLAGEPRRARRDRRTRRQSSPLRSLRLRGLR